MSSFINLGTFDSLCRNIGSKQLSLQATTKSQSSTSGELMSTSSAIFQHVANVQNSWRPKVGESVVDRSFKYHSLKRTKARQCEFTNVDFSAAAASDSDWASSKFFGTIFDDANFQLSNFESCRLLPSATRNTSISGCNFFGATFHKAKLKQCNIEASTFTSVDFSQATLTNLAFKYSTFESVSFRRANLNNVDLSNSNVEYCDFTDAHKNGLKLSLVQFAYTYGITYEDIRDNRVIIISDDENVEQLSNEQLGSLIAPLIQYYQINQSYFPCANLLYVSKNDNFKVYIEKAIIENILLIDLQELKHLCRLARYSGQFSQQELSAWYTLIEQKHLQGNKHQRHIWTLHDGDLRHHLLPQQTKNPILIGINFNSKLGDNQLESINHLTQAMAEAFAILGYSFRCSKIEFTQNSPGNLEIKDCKIEQLIVNNIQANNVTQEQSNARQTTGVEEKSKIRKSVEIISLVVSILAGTVTITAKVAEIYNITPKKCEDLKKCSERFNEKVVINAFYSNEGTANKQLMTPFDLSKIDKSQEI